MRAAEPPSWVALLADADVWVKALGAYAALFVAEIVKEAAKDSWRNRAKAPAIGSAALGLLGKLASSIALLKRRLADRTSVAIGLLVPNDYFATKIVLDAGDPEVLAGQLAFFVYHLPALSRLVEANDLDEAHMATGLFLQLQDDGSMLVSWHDRDTLEIRQAVLPLDGAVTSGCSRRRAGAS